MGDYSNDHIMGKKEWKGDEWQARGVKHLSKCYLYVRTTHTHYSYFVNKTKKKYKKKSTCKIDKIRGPIDNQSSTNFVHTTMHLYRFFFYHRSIVCYFFRLEWNINKIKKKVYWLAFFGRSPLFVIYLLKIFFILFSLEKNHFYEKWEKVNRFLCIIYIYRSLTFIFKISDLIDVRITYNHLHRTFIPSYISLCRYK
jgi:hypothetical protein